MFVNLISLNNSQLISQMFFIALLLSLSVSLVFSIKTLFWFVVGFEFLKVGFSVGC